MNRRFFSTIIIFIAIIILPYWVYIPLTIGAMAFFPFYWESIVLGFLIDVLYGAGFNSFSSIYTSTAFIVLIGLFVLVPLRERLRLHV